MIDFDNFICCLVKLEAMFSEYYCIIYRSYSTCMLYVCRLLSNKTEDYTIVKTWNFLTGYFQQFDKEGSGVAEMNITEVSSVSKENLCIFCQLFLLI